MPLRAAELEVLLTVDDKDVARAEKAVKATGQRIESKPITAEIDGDEKGAKASMDRVQAQAKQIVSQRTVATIDANIDRAEKGFIRAKERLDYLNSVSAELDVKADIGRAEANLQKVERQLESLRKVRTNLEVDMTTPEVDSSQFKKIGQDAGEELGKGLGDALAAIPIAGGIALAGVAVGAAFVRAVQEGLKVEADQDRLEALTGISPARARQIALAAGEAYASNFGESIEANMDTARLGLQFNIIDADTSTREAQKVIEGLEGIADVLGGDVRQTAEVVTTLLRTGMAASAQDAFDILAAGARNGVNRSEDLLDTFTEYPVVLARLGLSGREMLGLINQGLDAGARNSDVVADALKELQIRATDGSQTSADAYALIGLSAEEMTAKIAGGGEGAREGLQQILDGLRAMEDPVARNAAAVGLFGTKAEDLGESLFALDLSNAVDQLGLVTGAAQTMFNTLSDNDAAKMEGAKRNVEVAVQGIQGILATAFADPLADAAEFIAENRGPVLQFFLDLANGALDFGASVVEGAAVGTEAFGAFVSGPMADVLDGFGALLSVLKQDEQANAIGALVAQMRGFEEGTDAAAASIRNLATGAIDQARDRLNTFGEGAVSMAYLTDAAYRTAEAVAQVGVAADGTATSGELLEGQVRIAVTALQDQLTAAVAAGEGQAELQARYAETTEALVAQLTATGMEEQAARDLIAAYGAVPEIVQTTIDAQTAAAQAKVAEFVLALNNIPGRRDVIINQVWQETGAPRGQVAAAYNAQGAVMEFYARGGTRNLTPMRPIAQVVPPNTWRVVGDRGDVPESYIPHDGSERSEAILRETARRMGFVLMAEGGMFDRRRDPGGGPSVVVQVTGTQQEDPRVLGAIIGGSVRRVLPLVKRT